MNCQVELLRLKPVTMWDAGYAIVQSLPLNLMVSYHLEGLNRAPRSYNEQNLAFVYFYSKNKILMYFLKEKK